MPPREGKCSLQTASCLPCNSRRWPPPTAARQPHFNSGCLKNLRQYYPAVGTIGRAILGSTLCTKRVCRPKMVRFLNSPWPDPNKIGQKRSGPRSPVRGFWSPRLDGKRSTEVCGVHVCPIGLSREVIIEGKDPYILNCYVIRSATETAIAAGLEPSDESSKLKDSVELCLPR